jgi:hypothetical protein
VNLPAEEKVKDGIPIILWPQSNCVVFTCSMKGQKFKSKTSGKLYLTQSYLVFVTNNFLSKDHV